jgi:hypothetical protein
LSDASYWQGPSTDVPVVNADGNIFEEVQVAIAAQTLFTLTSFEYTPGSRSIFIWKKTATESGGEMLRRVTDYAETSSTTVTMVTPAAAGDVFFFISIAFNQLIAPTVFNGLPGGGTTGQLLTKTSSSDFESEWSDPSTISNLFDAARVNVVTASTVNLVAIEGTTRNVQLTGSIQVDGFQITNGQVWFVRLAASVIIKNNASIVTQSGQDIIASPGDTFVLRATADNVVEILVYSRAAASIPRIVNDFRLSLVTGNPVPTVDTTSSTIYLTPYCGNQISLFNGSSWETLTTAEISIALAGLVGGNRPYDIFAYNNSGAVALEMLVWTSTTARATALVRQDGIYVKSGDATRRYIGTFGALTANTTTDSANARLLWNYYNRVNSFLKRNETVPNWAYTVLTWRQARLDGANQVSVIVGVQEESLNVDLAVSVNSSAAAGTVEMNAGIGEDSTTVPVAGGISSSFFGSPTDRNLVIAKYRGIPAVGYHYYAWLERSTASGVTTWYGIEMSGLTGNWRC